jgi:hypothetical protein
MGRAAALAAWSLTLLAAACTHLTTDLNAPVAIEFVALTYPFVEVGDTLPLHVRVLDRAGDSIPGAPVQLVVLDTTKLLVDGSGLAVIGLDTTGAGAARVVAVSGRLRSSPFSIRVPVGHADSLVPTGVGVDTVASADSVSAPFTVAVLDLTTTPGSADSLPDRPVRFTIVDPVFGAADTATVRLPDDSLGQTVLTGTSGTASVTVKRKRGLQPDSVVVQAVATRSSGAALPGSPVRFVVFFSQP